MLNNYEEAYLDLLSQVKLTGQLVEGRNGDTLSCFGAMLKVYALEHDCFPVLTTRKMFINGILGELAAFVRGAEDLKAFQDFGCNYWDENAGNWSENSNVASEYWRVGRIYGAQWRNFYGVDQLSALIRGLREQPTSRRHLLTAYNPAELNKGCLPPCHLLAQYSVRGGMWLESCVYMRSVDLCVGLPTDVALYAAMQVVLAGELGLYPGAITFMLGDAHIYANHLPLLEEQLKRTPTELPRYDLVRGTKLVKFVPQDLILLGYTPQDRINYAFNV